MVEMNMAERGGVPERHGGSQHEDSEEPSEGVKEVRLPRKEIFLAPDLVHTTRHSFAVLQALL
jgi:hypothetical protein